MKKLLLLLVLLGGASTTFAQKTLYYNGKIYTADTARPFARYFGVEKGKINTLGDTLTPEELGQYSHQVDLQGRTVIPGLIDSHIHFIDGGLGMLQTSFTSVTTPAQMAQTITVTRQQLIDGMYIGRDLGYEALAGMESPLTMLDQLLPEVPALIFLKSGHAAIANCAAMRKFGFTVSTKIADGELPKDQLGQLSGYLLEGAAMEADRIVTSLYSAVTVEKAILTAQQRALSYGITTIGDNTFNPYFYKIYQQLQKNGLLTLRVRARSYGRIPQTASLMSGLGHKHLGLIGGGVDFTRVSYHATKLFVDQSLSLPQSGGAVVEPGGQIYMSEKELKETFLLHPAATFAFHVQGKQGLQHILDAYRAVQKRVPPHRHIIDHAGYASPEQLREARRLGLAVTILGAQAFDYAGLAGFYRNQAVRGKAFAEQDLLDARTKYQQSHGALTSDFPYGMDTLFTKFTQVDGLNPFPIMAVAATARYPDGSLIKGLADKTLSVQEAINAYTTHGAYVLGEEATLGKIAVGYRADFLVLENDPFAYDPMRLYDERVAETYLAGERVFSRSESGVQSARQLRLVQVHPTDYSISPVIGYDPALGLILGGACFKFPLKTPGRYLDFQMQTLLSGKFNVQATYTCFDIFKRANFTVAGSYSNFFQYYFGEGNQTRAEGYRKMYANLVRIRPELSLALPHQVRLNVYADLRGRHETRVTDTDNTDLHQTLFPDRYAVGIGASIQHDTRDNAFSTHKGTLLQATALYIPAFLSGGTRSDVAQFGRNPAFSLRL